MFPKILICAPTASAKAYCFEAWLDNVMALKYPNYQVVIFDNTLGDGGLFVRKMNDVFKYQHGATNAMFSAFGSKSNSKSVIERMCSSHNDCRNYFLEFGFDYMLHLETDVFCPEYTIEQLLSANKRVVSGMYDRDEGKARKPCLQKRIFESPTHLKMLNFTAGEEIGFCDGTVREVHHSGLGCCLIEKSVMQQIAFRFITGSNFHPDTFFAEDCSRAGIKIYVDTSLYCEHQNSDWGIHGVDFT